MADATGGGGDFYTALANLQNSTSGLNTNFSLPSLSGFKDPGYQNLGQNTPWNMTGADFASSTAAPAQNSGSGGGGFFSNLWSGIENGYDHLKGGMEGLAAGYAGYKPPSWEQTQNPNQDTTGQAFQREADMSGLGGIANALKGGWNGLVNPQQAQQDYQQNVTNPMSSMTAVPRFVNQFLSDTATDPLSYLPIGTIGKVTGITPALKFGFDLARGAVKGGQSTAEALTAALPELSAATSKSPLSNELLQLMPPPKTAGLLPEMTQSSQEAMQQALQKSIQDSQAVDINSWAGLDGGYKSAMEPVQIPSQSITGKGAKLTLQTPNDLLQQLFESVGKTSGPLSPGREMENLQDAWSSIAPKTAGSFEDLLKGVDTQKTLGQVLADVQAKNSAMRAYGIDPAEFLPKTVRPLGAQLIPSVKTVMQEVEKDPNFVMQYPLALRKEMGVVPAGELRNNSIYDAIGLTKDEAANLAAKTTAQDALGAATKEAAATGGSDAVQSLKAPYAAYNWQSKLGGPLAQKLSSAMPNGIPVLRTLLNNKFTDQLGKNFVRFYGSTPAVSDSLKNMENAKNADLQNIIGTMRGLAQQHGLNQDEMGQVVRVLEGIHPGGASDKVLSSAGDLKNLMENGISTPEGNVLGTQHELSAVDHTGKPTLDASKMRENYYPHLYNEKTAEKLTSATTTNRKVFSTKGASNKERTFSTVDDALKAGYKPEMNPYIAIGQRLAESSQKVRNAQLLKELGDAGVLSKDASDGLVSAGSIPQLNSYHVPENDLKALQSFLAPKQPGAFMQAYDKGLTRWKGLTTFNSLVHGHNIAYNGMWLGGAKPSYVREAFSALKNGAGDEWYQRALRAGAISADRGKFLDNLKSAVKGVSQPVRDKINYALHGALWDFDKSMRTALFRQAIEGGATDAEAAAHANKFLINYNNMTPFEQNVMSRVFPFYRWMKGNLPLQVEQWINNTPKQMLYEHAKNSVQQAINGQNLRSDGKIDSGIVLPDGSHVLIDPYSPADEPLKMLHDGILPTLYSKANPIIKLGAQLATNQKYYPGAPFAPNGKESMVGDSQRITQPGRDDNSASVASILLNALAPSSGLAGTLAAGAIGDTDSRGLINSALGLPTKQKPDLSLAEILTKLLGGFTSRDNPALDAYFQQKDAQAALKNKISEMYSQGIPIPKSLTKQEYQKIPYPATGTGN